MLTSASMPADRSAAVSKWSWAMLCRSSVASRIGIGGVRLELAVVWCVAAEQDGRHRLQVGITRHRRRRHLGVEWVLGVVHGVLLALDLDGTHAVQARSGWEIGWAEFDITGVRWCLGMSLGPDQWSLSLAGR